MRIHVYSLKKPVYDGEGASLKAKTPLGEITVLDDHAPLITSVLPKEAVVTSRSGEKISFPLESGFLEVKPKGQVTLIID